MSRPLTLAVVVDMSAWEAEDNERSSTGNNGRMKRLNVTCVVSEEGEEIQ